MMAEDCRRLVYVTAVLAVAYLLLVDRVHGAVVNSTEDNSTLTYVDAPVPGEPAGHPGSTPRSQYVQRRSCALEEGNYICAIPRICCENNTTCCASCFKDKCALPQKSEKYVRAMICMGFVAFVILFYSFHKRLRRCCKRGKDSVPVCCLQEPIHFSTQQMDQQHMNQQLFDQQRMNQQLFNQQHMNQQLFDQQHMNQQLFDQQDMNQQMFNQPRMNQQL